MINQEEEECMIALYYTYTPVPSVKEHMEFQKRICAELSSLGGRIRVSLEGINGVLSGTKSHLQSYEHSVHEELIISSTNGATTIDLNFKYCKLRSDLNFNNQMFDSLKIQKTREVVSLDDNNNDNDTDKNDIIRNNRHRNNRRRRGRDRHGKKQHSHPNNDEYVDVTTTISTDEDNTNNNNNITTNNNETTSTTQLEPESRPVLPPLSSFERAQHLSPDEWHTHLLERSHDDDVILIDIRNVYESKVGYFEVDGIPTLLTNTRKYSSLPQVLEASIPYMAGKTVYMYCTGGVRCERASQYLQKLITISPKWTVSSDNDDTAAPIVVLPPPKKVYQLSGGIQKYLEEFGAVSNNNTDDDDDDANTRNCCLFRGKNFVFDPRRTDPVVGSQSSITGRCILCNAVHDDYDNGYAPCLGHEARCCRCRVLILVCNPCREINRCWGEEEENNSNSNNNIKTPLFCGPKGISCVDQGNFVDAIQFVNKKV